MKRPRGLTGILGGTFDPVHLGHVAAATAAREALGLDRVLLVPSSQPPHRNAPPHASGFHRFAMVSLAVRSQDGLLGSDIELVAGGPSFTAVTLRALHGLGLTGSQLFFITGTDAFAEIATWHDYPAVLDLAHFVVISRPGQSFDALRARLSTLARGARPDISSPGIFLVNAQTPDVSSTEVRTRVAAGSSLAGFVAPDVEAHILKHRLYAEGGAGRAIQAATPRRPAGLS